MHSEYSFADLVRWKQRTKSRDARVHFWSGSLPWLELEACAAQQSDRVQPELVVLSHILSMRADDAQVQSQLDQIMARNHAAVREELRHLIASAPKDAEQLVYFLTSKKPSYTIRVRSGLGGGHVTREVALNNTTAATWPAGTRVAFSEADHWARCHAGALRPAMQPSGAACDVALAPSTVPGAVKRIDASMIDEAYLPTSQAAGENHGTGAWGICVNEEGVRVSRWRAP